MDEKSKFDLLFNSRKEEEKSYLFLDDEDEEKITFNQGRNKFEFDFEGCEPEEDCSDWDKEWKSQILAELRTNDSNYNIWDQENDENDDAKFLMRLGLLEVDDSNLFNINENLPSSPFESCDDIHKNFTEREIPLHQKIDQNKWDLFLIDEVSIGNEVDLSMKDKELIAMGLPRLETIDDADPDAHTNNEINRIPPQLSTWTQSINYRNDQEDEEAINTVRQNRKKYTEFNNMLNRKAFRMMRKYFKTSFENFGAPFQYKVKVRIMSPEEMDNLVFQYIKREFDVLSEFINANDLPQIILGLKQIILSDRFNKEERVILGINFELIRTLFNKCTKISIEEFSKVPANCILFIHFFLKQGRHIAHKQQDVDKQKFQKQIEFLVELMFSNLPYKLQEIYSPILSSIIPS